MLQAQQGGAHFLRDATCSFFFSDSITFCLSCAGAVLVRHLDDTQFLARYYPYTTGEISTRWFCAGMFAKWTRNPDPLRVFERKAPACSRGALPLTIEFVDSFLTC